MNNYDPIWKWFIPPIYGLRCHRCHRCWGVRSVWRSQSFQLPVAWQMFLGGRQKKGRPGGMMELPSSWLRKTTVTCVFVESTESIESIKSNLSNLSNLSHLSDLSHQYTLFNLYNIYLIYLLYLIYLVYLIYLIYLIYHIYLVYLIYLNLSTYLSTYLI